MTSIPLALRLLLALLAIFELSVHALAAAWAWSAYSLCAQWILLGAWISLVGAMFFSIVPLTTLRSLAFIWGSAVTLALGLFSFGALAIGGNAVCTNRIGFKVSFLPFVILLGYCGLFVFDLLVTYRSSGRNKKQIGSE
jgi:hypothetical protein